jgi:hypothetical protein
VRRRYLVTELRVQGTWAIRLDYVTRVRVEKNGRQNEYFKRKRLDFLRSTNLKFVNEIKGYGCDSLRLIISVRGGNLHLQFKNM